MINDEISMTYDENRDGMFWQPLWDLVFILLAVMPIDSMEQRSFGSYRTDWSLVEQDKEYSPSVLHPIWTSVRKLYFIRKDGSDGNTRKKT
jgi:hypothetical protein